MKKVNIIILSIAISLTSCNTSNENKIIGKWKGSYSQKSYYGGRIHSLITEMEFDENGKGWYRNQNIEDNKTFPISIFEYKVVEDSIIFINTKYNKNLYIEYISENKLILNKFSESSGTERYELDKVAE